MKTGSTIIAAFMGVSVLASPTGSAKTNTFAQDVSFIGKHAHAVVLSNGSSKVVLVPQWQAKVMTSAISGDQPGFGWINYDYIKAGKIVPHINVYGGEDRIWLGPEGGQFSIFFKKGSTFDLAHWQTPAFFDSQPFKLVSQTKSSATCAKDATVTNYSGHTFHVGIRRTVKVMSKKSALGALGVSDVPGVQVVGYESENTLTNKGKNGWNENTGMLSIWILGMLRHSPTTTVFIPFNTGDDSTMGPIVNDKYFGKVPDDRLKIGDGVLFFKADGKYRSKIGLNPHRAKDVIGSWDPVGGVLTIVKFDHPEGVTKYVNSMWEIQKEPFGGDIANSYNDGPPSPGAKPLGPFYEVESSSPAAELAPGASITHVHRTFHFKGPKDSLQVIADKVFGVKLDDVASALGG